MTDPIIEAAARALREAAYRSITDDDDDNPLPTDDDFIRAVLAAVTPLIRAAALEEAAQELELATVAEGQYLHLTPKQIAAAIRALKEQP